MFPLRKGRGPRLTTLHLLTAVATAVLIFAVQAIMRLRSRQTFRITRLSDREYRISFEQPTEEDVVHVAHTVLRELGWNDEPGEARIAPLVALRSDGQEVRAGSGRPGSRSLRGRSPRVS
jgi:hypothetical protein